MNQESTQYLPIKFNIIGGEVNQFIEAFKERSQKNFWNSYPTPVILNISVANVADLNMFDNYGHLKAIDITRYCRRRAQGAPLGRRTSGGRGFQRENVGSGGRPEGRGYHGGTGNGGTQGYVRALPPAPALMVTGREDM